jgi:hypothetical protein
MSALQIYQHCSSGQGLHCTYLFVGDTYVVIGFCCTFRELTPTFTGLYRLFGYESQQIANWHPECALQIHAWNRAPGTALLPAQQKVMLAAPGNAAILSEVFATLAGDAAAANRARMHACAGRVAANATLPDAQAHASQAAVLRVAAATGALGGGTNWDTASDREIADAFANAVVADGAHNEALLCASVAAVTISQCASPSFCLLIA